WAESAVTSLVPAIAASAASSGESAVMDAWAIRYPTFTPVVALVIRQMLERLARALRLDPHLTPQSAPSDATPRPHDCHLASNRLEAMGIGRRTPFDTAIRQVLAAFPRRSQMN